MGKLKPSSAKVWLECPKSPALSQIVPFLETRYTIKGTQLHLKAAYDIREAFEIPQVPMEILVTSDEQKQIEGYVAFCRDTIKGIYGDRKPNILVEEKINLAEFLYDGNGIIDFAAYDDDAILVVDYKTGFVNLYALGNPQLYIYAFGLLRRMRMHHKEPRNIYVAICQPGNDNYSLVQLTARDLDAWAESIKGKIVSAYTNSGTYVPGKHCSHCPARAICRAYLLYALKGGLTDENENEDA